MKNLGPFRPARVTQSAMDALAAVLTTADRGSIVFNTTDEVWYWWTGTEFLPISIAPLTGFDTQVLAADVPITAASTEQDIDSYMIALPGLWRVSAYVQVEMNDIDIVIVKFTDVDNVELAKAKLESSDTGVVVFPATLRRHITTTTADEIIKLRAIALTTTAKILAGSTGGTKADWQRIDVA